jgi:hypothetical protein
MFSPNADPFSRHLVRIEHQELWQKIEADRLYISTARKHSLNVIKVIHNALSGNPFPPFTEQIA